MKVALFLSLVIHFSLIAFAKESPKTGSKIEDVNGDLESCYRGLYDTGKKSLINETEWRSYRDMIYVTIRLEQFHEGNNTVTIVFAKSVVFFLIDPLMLKKITTPLLQLFGMVYPYPVEQIKVVLDVPACSNNTMVLTVTQSVQNVLELAAQRVATSIEMSGKAAYYATVYDAPTMQSRQPVFMAFLWVVLVCLSLASAGLVGKHVHQLMDLILQYAKSAHYHAFVVFSFVLGSVLTMTLWLVWLFVVFVSANTWEGWLLLSALLVLLCCFVPAEIMAIKNMNLFQKENWIRILTDLPLATSLLACIQFASFLFPFLLLSLLSWPLLTTASVLFAYSLSCCCYGGIVVVFLVAIVTISGFCRQHENCLLGTLIIIRDCVILGCAILGGMSVTLILGYFLIILFNGTHQDTSSILPFLFSLLSTFGTTLIALSIHKILFSMKKPTNDPGEPPGSPLTFDSDDDKKPPRTSKYGALSEPIN